MSALLMPALLMPALCMFALQTTVTPKRWKNISRAASTHSSMESFGRLEP